MLQVEAHVLRFQFESDHAAPIMRAAGESRFDGDYAGARILLSDNTEDHARAPRSGHLAELSAESWGRQAGENLSLTKVGVSIAQYMPLDFKLLPTEWILAGHLAGEGGWGPRSYFTSASLGGGTSDRGYVANRFRGDSEVHGNLELRRRLYENFRAVLFADTGRVWNEGDLTDSGLHSSLGAGLRYFLPPARKVKVRLDFGFSQEESTVFFAFGEAF
jgi:outer membrane protein assembly factor BamA